MSTGKGGPLLGMMAPHKKHSGDMVEFIERAAIAEPACAKCILSNLNEII